MTEPAFTLRFAREADWLLVVEEIRAHGGVMFRHAGDRALTPLAEVPVAFLGPDGEICRVPGRVVRLTATEVAFTFDEAAQQAIFTARFAGPAPPDEEAPLWQRWDSLSKADKIHLARHGNAEARRRVLRDRDQTLHIHVLSNAGLTPPEVAALVRGGAANAQFFQALVRRDDLLRHPAVIEAVVTNPHSPIRLAVDLVPRLVEDTARRIAREGRLRQAIVQAARKRVVTR